MCTDLVLCPQSSKKAKKNDDDDDDKEDVEGLEVNYVYVGIVCVLYILLVWATTLVISFGVYGIHWHCVYCVLTSLLAHVEYKELEVGLRCVFMVAVEQPTTCLVSTVHTVSL